MKSSNNLKNFLVSTGLLTSVLVTDGLYNNLQGQTLRNNNTIYVDDYTKEEINLPKTRDKILQGLSPEIQKETMRIWNNVLQSPYAEIYMRAFANPLSRPRPTDQQKAFLLIIIGDIHQDSKLKQTAWQSIENDKVLLHGLKSRFKTIKSSINILILDEQIVKADKIIEGQKNTLEGQKNTLKGQEDIKRTLDMIEAEFNKRLQK